MGEGKKKLVQIYLREDQVKSLKIVAERRGESVASLVRQGVDRLLEDIPPEEDPLLDLVAIFDSGKGDLASKHDEYLVKLIQEERDHES